MIHLAFFGYFFLLSAGVVCLAIALYLYLKIRSRYLFHFLTYFSAFTLFVFSYLVVLTYINANLAQVRFYILLPVLAIVLLSYSLLLFSSLHFAHFLVYEKTSIKRNVAEILTGVLAFVGTGSSLVIDWDKGQVYQSKSLGLIFSAALLFAVIGYSLALKLYHAKHMDGERRRILVSTSMMNLMVIPGFFIDVYLLQTIRAPFFIPVYYVCSAILFLRLFMKKHSADLASARSVDDSKMLGPYLARTGISAREREVISLLMRGYSNRKIAGQLFISLSTVKTHIKNIFQKLDVKSRFEIITKLKNIQQDEISIPR